MSWWRRAVMFSTCFFVRLNLPGLRNLFGLSAAFAFLKAGEVLAVSFLHKLLLPLLEQSCSSASLSPPRVCSCYGEMCVYVFAAAEMQHIYNGALCCLVERHVKKKWFLLNKICRRTSFSAVAYLCWIPLDLMNVSSSEAFVLVFCSEYRNLESS